ncbi:carboxymuconolactone decarboxylase family protein [Micromonospora sp. STR1s_5]|nr:carboxymuconolactone decarboxylase family protein [Micromonospora sp. STR1s_5]
MMDRQELCEAAAKAGVESFEATFGRVPENFRLLAEHAPAAFAGYGLMRDGLMRDTAQGGALDLKTKELVFALLDTLLGQTTGAKNHAAAAMRLGLTLPELSEGLVQVVMAGGITTWNRTGADVLRHCVELAAQQSEHGAGG